MEPLHAPWRIAYIRAPKPVPATGHVFKQIADSSDDVANFVILRARSCFALLNCYPYTGGHLMVVPYKLTPDLNGLDDDELTELFQVVRRCKNALSRVMNPDGFNIGINVGRVAGAGIVDHLHVHVVPRWSGDTNFMPVLATTTVVPEALTEVAAQLRAALAADFQPQFLMPTETIHFENPRLAQQVFNNEPRNLQAVEQELGVKAVARENWIKLEGPGENLERARELFQSLEGLLKSGGSVRNREFAHALSVVKNEGAEALRNVFAERINTSPRKAPVVPKTIGQKKYVDAIRAHDVVFGIGPAGTGKTYLAMAMALAALKEEKVARIILTRPAVEAGEALGFLPGDLYEKITPYLRPLHDALHDMLPAEEIEKDMERGVIEIAPLAYMRGRTLNHAFIVLDEAQNSTTEQMFMFLTRLGIQSKAVITGDLTQIDLPPHKHSGLAEAERALHGIEGIALVQFSRRDVVRHPLVQRIIAAYEEHRGKK